MNALTKKQQQILDFIQQKQQTTGRTPSFREVAAHFGFRSMSSAVEHVRLIQNKGFIERDPRKARSLRIVSPFQSLRQRIADIPVFGSIPAGFPEESRQEAQGCLSIDIRSLGLKPGPNTFALEVRGDSMIGKQIMDGDLVVLEHGRTPRTGDVVAALIDHESTLKTFRIERGQPWLQAENPRYPKLIPASDLLIQGVMVALIRKCK